MQYNRKNLLKAVTTICKVVSKNAGRVQPILQCLVLTQDSVRGTDLDLDLTLDLGKQDENGGWRGSDPSFELITPAHTLQAILKALKADIVDIDIAGDSALINELKLEIFASDDYPKNWPERNSTWKGPGVIANLAEILDKTLFAAASYDDHNILAGVYFDCGQVAATDGSRLSYVATKNTTMKHIVPARLLKKLVGLRMDTVTVLHNSSHVEMTGNGWTANIRCISGEYPRYQELFPKPEVGSLWTFDRLEMLECLDTLKLTLDKRTNLIDFHPGTEMVMTTSGYISGESKANLNTGSAKIGGEMNWISSAKPASFSLNWNYWKQLLESLSGKSVSVQWQGAFKPLVVTEGNYKHLLMPVQSKHANKDSVQAKVLERANAKIARPKPAPKTKVAKVAKVAAKSAQHNPAPPPQEVTAKWTISMDDAIAAEDAKSLSMPLPAPASGSDAGSTIAANVRPSDSPCYHTSRTCAAVPCALAPSAVA